VLTRRVTAVVAALYLCAGVAMTQLRLLNTLGYESALVFALIAAIVGVVLPLRVIGRPSAEESIGRMLARALRSAGVGLLLLALPFAALLVNAAFVRNCALFDGALFWLLIPAPTVIFSTALVLLLRQAVGRRAGAVYALLLLLFLLQPFVQIFSRPQLFAYNHVFGMFLGLSWDQTQPPFATLLLYRLSTLAYSILLLTAAAALQLRRTGRLLPAPSRTLLIVVFLPALAAVLYFSVESDRLGFTSSYGQLERELAGEYVSGPVKIRYDSTQLSAEDITLVAREHRFQLERVCSELGVRWEGVLTSYLYPDSESKKRLLGTESSQIARPWRHEIHLSADYWREAVKHEIVHVVAGEFGPYLNRAPFLRVLGLTEGLAMAVEWSWGNRTLHQHAAAMQAYDILPTAEQCIGTLGFATNSSSVSYVASGSLTRWLMDTLGVAVIRRAYAEDDLASVTGLSYEAMNTRWRAFLRTVPRALPDSIATMYAFTRPSLFTALCPREITERGRRAARALRDRRFEEALRLYRASERMAPNARAVFGITGAWYQLGMMDSVRTATARWLRDSSRAASLYPLLLWQGAASWTQSDSAAADRALTALAHERPPGWPAELAARMRRALRLSADARPALRETLLGALRREENEDSLRTARAARLAAILDERSVTDAAVPVVIEEWLRLVARDAEGRARARARLETFPREAMHLELLLRAGAVFYAERMPAEAERYFRAAETKTADRMVRRDIEEWLARCRFLLEHEDVQ
jgi:hypothetical protein